MKSKSRVAMLAASCLMAFALNGTAAFAADQAAEPLSKSYRITRAKDVEYQKIEPFKAFDNLYYVGPGYVSVWLLKTPQGDILFDSAQEPYVDHVMNNIKKVGSDIKNIKYIILSHGHLDHVGGAARLQEASGARVVAVAEDWKMMEDLAKTQGRDGSPAPRMPKRDMVVKEGDTLKLGDQSFTFHQTPGHTPGVLTTEGITLIDGGKPYRAILWGGTGYRGGVAEAQQSVESVAKVAKIQGVQVNLQIHSWSEPNGYQGGGVLERSLLLKTRKAGDPNPFVDPAAYQEAVKRSQNAAASDLAKEKQKAAAK